jgi:hypothetical protein
MWVLVPRTRMIYEVRLPNRFAQVVHPERLGVTRQSASRLPEPSLNTAAIIGNANETKCPMWEQFVHTTPSPQTGRNRVDSGKAPLKRALRGLIGSSEVA